MFCKKSLKSETGNVIMHIYLYASEKTEAKVNFEATRLENRYYVLQTMRNTVT